MKKQQLILTIGGLVVLFGLLFFGKIDQKKPAVRPENNPMAAGFNIEDQLKRSKISLNPAQASFVTKIEKEAEFETDNLAKGKLYQQLASYWHDSAQNHELFVFYTNKAALLVNSEKISPLPPD